MRKRAPVELRVAWSVLRRQDRTNTRAKMTAGPNGTRSAGTSD